MLLCMFDSSKVVRSDREWFFEGYRWFGADMVSPVLRRGSMLIIILLLVVVGMK